MILLELKDVRKSYGYDENKVNAINHIHLTIDEGSFVAIIGKSGAANQLYYTSWVDLPNHSKGLSY